MISSRKSRPEIFYFRVCSTRIRYIYLESHRESQIEGNDPMPRYLNKRASHYLIQFLPQDYDAFIKKQSRLSDDVLCASFLHDIASQTLPLSNLTTAAKYIAFNEENLNLLRSFSEVFPSEFDISFFSFSGKCDVM